MTLRTRILFAYVLLALVPLAILAAGVRLEMSRRLAGQYARRAEVLAAVIEDDLAARSRDLAGRLGALGAEIAADNRFRLLAAGGGPSADRPYLIDYAERAMRLAGLSMLQIQDGGGRILSSGHFRNEFDRLEPEVAHFLAAAPAGTALVRARRPEGPFLALGRVDSLRLGGARFFLVGGFEVDRALLAALARSSDLAVTLAHPGDPGGTLSSDPAIEGLVASTGGASSLARDFIVRTLDLPFVSAGSATGSATLLVSHARAPLREIVASLDRWLALVLTAAVAGVLILALWLSVALSRPLAVLARKTAALDLDHLDAGFAGDRTDEVGVLSRFLAAMTRRLRASAEALRAAERRATLGELARQVNHDLKNGVAPIRNVVRHLGHVARERPAELGGVFLERQSTLEASLAYLEDLAANYARLSPRLAREPLDLNEVVREAAPAGMFGDRVRIELELEHEGALPRILADRTGMRRIVENLVRNARESLGEGSGTVTIATRAGVDRAGRALAVLVVRDTGRGIAPEDRGRVFEQFYTTKTAGTGLGLAIVRRLVTDFEGGVRIESEPGRGTELTLEFPAHSRRGGRRRRSSSTPAPAITTAACGR
jgi:signal transduction histidine kinase